MAGASLGRRGPLAPELARGNATSRLGRDPGGERAGGEASGFVEQGRFGGEQQVGRFFRGPLGLLSRYPAGDERTYHIPLHLRQPQTDLQLVAELCPERASHNDGCADMIEILRRSSPVTEMLIGLVP